MTLKDSAVKIQIQTIQKTIFVEVDRGLIFWDSF